MLWPLGVACSDFQKNGVKRAPRFPRRPRGIVLSWPAPWSRCLSVFLFNQCAVPQPPRLGASFERALDERENFGRMQSVFLRGPSRSLWQLPAFGVQATCKADGKKKRQVSVERERCAHASGVRRVGTAHGERVEPVKNLLRQVVNENNERFDLIGRKAGAALKVVR